MDKLIGKSISHLFINGEKDLLKAICDDGSIFYLSAVGGCCSQSWFEHITGVDALFNQQINRIVAREMPEPIVTDDEFDVTKVYGWTFETDRGRCDFEMRNHSNGYYGGWCEVSEIACDQYNERRDDESSADKAVTEDF